MNKHISLIISEIGLEKQHNYPQVTLAGRWGSPVGKSKAESEMAREPRAFRR